MPTAPAAKKKPMGMGSVRPQMQGPISGGAGGGVPSPLGPPPQLNMQPFVGGPNQGSRLGPGARPPMPLPPSAAPNPGRTPPMMAPPPRPGPPAGGFMPPPMGGGGGNFGGPMPGRPQMPPGGGFMPPGQPTGGPPMMGGGMPNRGGFGGPPMGFPPQGPPGQGLMNSIGQPPPMGGPPQGMPQQNDPRLQQLLASMGRTGFQR